MPDIHLGTNLPSRFVPRSRSYSNIVFDPNTSLIIAASSLQAQFASFDEDGNKVWEPDSLFIHFFRATSKLIRHWCARQAPTFLILYVTAQVLSSSPQICGLLWTGKLWYFGLACIGIERVLATNLPKMNLSPRLRLLILKL